ncbi:PepSY domain-containing protein [uncultured Tateyamaria sp.]|uniref:PepSY domain-containing protein n=1 Tax=uncultured Tateyamaria sp. TaxID=455651 RepID=UPI00262AE5EC|nr:PepSY domain-containing protein [uncultured Tateyamaria sp.]
MSFKLSLAVLSTVLVLPLSAGATGVHTCEATNKADWMSKADLTTKLESEGWSVRFMKEDGGCWEVYGTTPEGERVEGYFHPVTGAPELIGQRGRVLFKAGSDD